MRFFHDGTELEPKLYNKPELGGTCIAIPPKWWPTDPRTGKPVPTYRQCVPGSIAFTYGDQFYTVPPGGWVELPPEINEDNVGKRCSEHLVPEAKAIEMGIAEKEPEVVPVKKVAAIPPKAKKIDDVKKVDDDLLK